MKPKYVFLWLVCLAFIVTGHAQTQTPWQTATTLEQALRGKGADAKRQFSSLEWETRFTELRAAARRSDVAAAMAVVQQIEVLELPDTTRALCHDLLDGIRKERSARNGAFIQRVSAAIKKASEACRNAKSESELNPTQHELDTFRAELKLEPNEPRIEGLAMRLQWTAEAVSTWQDVLALRAKGYEKEATKRSETATDFVKGEEDFKGPRNVQATMNPDGSAETTWENVPGEEGETPIQITDATGHPMIIGVAPAGATSYHIPSGREKPKPTPHPHRTSPSPNGPAEQKASGAEAGHNPEGSGTKPVD